MEVYVGHLNLGSIDRYNLMNSLSKKGTLASNPLSATPLSALKTSNMWISLISLRFSLWRSYGVGALKKYI